MSAAMTILSNRIVQDPAIMVGKPVIKGTRIPVGFVLEHLAANPDLDDLFAAYPWLTIDDVKAVLAYARSNRRARVRSTRSSSRSDVTG